MAMYSETRTLLKRKIEYRQFVEGTETLQFKLKDNVSNFTAQRTTIKESTRYSNNTHETATIEIISDLICALLPLEIQPNGRNNK